MRGVVGWSVCILRMMEAVRPPTFSPLRARGRAAVSGVFHIFLGASAIRSRNKGCFLLICFLIHCLLCVRFSYWGLSDFRTRPCPIFVLGGGCPIFGHGSHIQCVRCSLITPLGTAPALPEDEPPLLETLDGADDGIPA